LLPRQSILTTAEWQGRPVDAIFFVPGMHCDCTYLQEIFFSELGSVRPNSEIIDVPEIECFLIDPSQAVTKRK
jgi:hypothetical protein